MKYKICLECNKRFYREDCKIAGAWTQKKYCSEECRINYHKQFLKHKLKYSFHNKMLTKLNKEINGKINLVQCNSHKENPDIETKDTNYEIEIFSNIHKWRNKYRRYKENNKKHTLIIIPDKRLKKYFDKIQFRKFN